MAPQTAFAIFPSSPKEIGQTLEQASRLAPSAIGLRLSTWPQAEVAGRFIIEGILEKLDGSDFVVADITKLNFNVTFEIGYSLGRGKKLLLVMNQALQPEQKDINRLGLFDTIGYVPYTNTQQLMVEIGKHVNREPIKFPRYVTDRGCPIYVVDAFHKSDAVVRTLSRIKKSKLGFRSFDPAEQPRLSAAEAFKGVASAVAVVGHLLSSRTSDFRDNNLRVAFVAGLSYGLQKETLLFQDGGDEPVPMDYRDLVSVIKHPTDVDAHIADLVPKVTEAALRSDVDVPGSSQGLIQKIDLGASAAENEASTLANYYVPTDHYRQALSGNVRLVVGRKGSGKTALFFQVRNKVRSDKRAVVIDLKPEGHQLKRFKEYILAQVSPATREHLATAFWEYVLLLELCYKILEKDRQVHIRDHTLYEPYQRLSGLYFTDTFVSEGDFSERMNRLVQRIADEFGDQIKESVANQLTAGQVTDLIYKHDIRKLREEIKSYLSLKKEAWMLFDNIDKGWPTRGVQPDDILILRSLLEASRKIEQYYRQNEIVVRSIVFVRNDVYELLVNETSDRGKDAKVSVDWTDRDLLKEVLRKRLVACDEFDNKDLAFAEVWRRVSASHINGEDTAEFLVERSLMRPRNLLNIVNYCKSSAVNLKHEKILPEDIQKAVRLFSADLGNEVGLEVRDVFPEAEDLLYSFIGCEPRITLGKVFERLEYAGISSSKHRAVAEILLWFSFLGLCEMRDDEPVGTFVYDVFYDMKKLRKMAGDLKDPETAFMIHRAFWPFLEIDETT